MISVTRRIEFDAAHRVVGHENKCKYLHGHRYALEVTCSAVDLDKLGRVIDFGVIKEKLGEWIERHWDHTAILWEKDKALGEAIARETKQTIFYLDGNPTVENMANHLLKVVCPAVFKGTGVACTAVRIYETPNCRVDAVLG